MQQLEERDGEMSHGAVRILRIGRVPKTQAVAQALLHLHMPELTGWPMRLGDCSRV